MSGKNKVMSEPVAMAPALQVVRVSSSEIQNNFGKYLEKVRKGVIVLITKNGSDVARMVSPERDLITNWEDIPESEAFKDLRELGICVDKDYEEAKAEYFREKYGVDL